MSEFLYVFNLIRLCENNPHKQLFLEHHPGLVPGSAHSTGRFLHVQLPPSLISSLSFIFSSSDGVVTYSSEGYGMERAEQEEHETTPARKPFVRTHYVRTNNAKFSGHYVYPRTESVRAHALRSHQLSS